MFRNYLKVAWRSLWRHKGFSFINLFGLATGMSVCLLVCCFIQYETGYDAMYGKNVYRLCEIQQEEGAGSGIKNAQTKFPAAPALKAEIPGVMDFARIISWEKVPLQTADQTGVEATTFGTDASFFAVFGITLLNGDTGTALKEPGSIVLTQSLAHRLFGNADPMGQIVHLERRDTITCRVTGILPDIPEKSHMQFEALYSLSTEERPGWMQDWSASWSFTYLRLNEHADIKKLQAAFPVFLRKHIPQTGASRLALFLQPLQNIHLYSADITHDLLNTRKFDGSYIPLLIAVALFVLLLGMINYINLSTARLMTRAKEVGIRKTNGAAWRDVVLQFLSETFIFSFAAFVLAMIITIIVLPLLNRLLHIEIDSGIFDTPSWLFIAALIIIFTGLAAGLLPAITMARIQPVAALKGRMWTSHRSPLRNALVIVQFTIAIGLSMAALTVLRQLTFIQQYDLGFNKEAVIIVPVGYADRQKEEVFIQQLKQIAGVHDVTGAIRRLGGSVFLHDVVFKSDRDQYTARCATMFVDYNYLSFYDIPLLAGRNFSPQFGADRNSQTYIINETMARQLLAYSSSRDTSPATLVGKAFRFGFQDSMGTIIGVTHDFNFNSLHQRIEPLCLTYLHEYYFTDLSLRLDAAKTRETIRQAERLWKGFLPNQQFSWYFLDSYLQRLYSSDTQMGMLMAIFTIIAFLISCLGLIGVAAFTIERRTKEIGVRKVVGATTNNIIFLLSKDFAKLVLISISIALPVAWWAIFNWLQNFAYHTTIRWWMFALVGIAALLISLFIVYCQSARAATANPVKSIQVE